ncbi:hypothetical protein GGI20_004253 [Coemansia sp. BCRC 34301]|nr:hypothetical protein GGI20_004253 [Coemansia sp. BCRC 34301]
MSFQPQANFMFLDPFSTDATVRARQQTSDGVATGSSGACYVGNHLMAGNAMYSQPGSSMMAVDAAQHQVVGHLTTTALVSGDGGAADNERNHSPSSTHSVSSYDHAQRRAAHNAIERARRESLNGQFQDLASAVPALLHIKRPSKATIVEKSLEYVRSFREHLASRDLYIRKLQVRNLALHDQVNHLRRQLGMEPISESAEPTLPPTTTIALLPADATANAKEEGIEEEDEEEDDNEDEDEEEEEEEEDKDQDRPRKKRMGASLNKSTGSLPMSSSSLSPPTALSEQAQQLRKRRQQSLDLRTALDRSTGRPVLRVQTAALAKQTLAAEASGLGMPTSRASPQQHSSPLSAPELQFAAPFASGKVSMPVATNFMYSHHQAPAPMAAGVYHHPSNAAAVAAAAFVAHAGVAQQPLQLPSTQTYSVMNLGNVPMTAVQLNSVMGINIGSNPSATSSLQVGSMAGFMTQPHHPPPASSLGLIDLASIPDMFAAVSTSSASPPLLTEDGMAQSTNASQFNY